MWTHSTGGERRKPMADLTIKYKGQTIAELSESGTKTLKTAGKYCEGDITVEYAKPAGGGNTYQIGHAVSVLEVNTDMFEARAVGYVPKKYYYNDVLLPEIPPYVLTQYPYAVIIKSLQDIGYRLYAGSKKTYFVVDQDINKLVIPESSRCRYNYKGNNWDFVNTYNTATYFNMSEFELVWSNHDIPNGSATATEIYFNGSEPVPIEETTE